MKRGLHVPRQSGVEIVLETPPGEAREHVVTWKETRVPGVIEVVYPDGVASIGFETIVSVELYDRKSQPFPCATPDSTAESVVEPPTEPRSIPTADAPVQIINLIRNSGFETSPPESGWEWGGQIYTAPGRNGGTAVCSTQKDGDEFLWIGIEQQVAVTPEQGYEFTAWLKMTDATQAHLKVLWLDELGQEVSVSSVACCFDGTSNDWISKGGNVSAPRGAVAARLIIWHGVRDNTVKVPGSTVCVDDVRFSTTP